MTVISPERQHIAKVFKEHVDRAIAELDAGYQVDLQGDFNASPIRIVVEVSAVGGIP